MASGLPAEFVELGEPDLAAVRRTVPLVLAHEAALTDEASYWSLPPSRA